MITQKNQSINQSIFQPIERSLSRWCDTSKLTCILRNLWSFRMMGKTAFHLAMDEMIPCRQSSSISTWYASRCFRCTRFRWRRSARTSSSCSFSSFKIWSIKTRSASNLLIFFTTGSLIKAVHSAKCFWHSTQVVRYETSWEVVENLGQLFHAFAFILQWRQNYKQQHAKIQYFIEKNRN